MFNIRCILKFIKKTLYYNNGNNSGSYKINLL